jgi:hypothetical protein
MWLSAMVSYLPPMIKLLAISATDSITDHKLVATAPSKAAAGSRCEHLPAAGAHNAGVLLQRGFDIAQKPLEHQEAQTGKNVIDCTIAMPLRP